MFKRFITATKLRDQANQDDQVARGLLVQATQANIQARERRDEALARDQEEAKARLYAMVYSTEQVWRTADVDAKSANEDAQTTLAIATQAQSDFETAAQHERKMYDQYMTAQALYNDFCDDNGEDDGEDTDE